MTLRPYQETAVARVFEHWRERGERRVALVLPTGAGKGHPLDTEVPTPKGLRLWGDLSVGDEVYGSDGHPTSVTGVYDRGELNTYEVTLKHGEKVTVDGDHLWQVQRKGRKPRVVSTRWLLDQPLKDADGYCWSVPVVEPIQRPKTELLLGPYVVGALIANGGLTSSGTMLVTPDEEVVARVGQAVQVQRCPDYPGRTCPTYSLPGLVSVTRHLGLRVHSREKRIPRAYLEAHIEDRVALLQGLMDADGSVRQGGRRSTRYSTTSSGLAQDLQELVTSLGGTASIRSVDRSAEGKPVEYSASLLLPVGLNVMSTGRKVATSAPRKLFRPRSAITAIRPVGRAKIRCISVAAPDQLYAVTRAHIVTHNTITFGEIIRRYRAETGEKVLVLAHRAELLDQAAESIRRWAPDLRVGMVKAGMNQVSADVVVASQQTLARGSRLARMPEFGLVVVDECHRSSGDSYLKVLDGLGCLRSDGPLTLGVTATFTREDSRRLTDFYESVPFALDILDLITSDPPYLVPPRFKRVLIEGLDLSGVPVSRVEGGRDLSGTELAEAMDRAGAPGIVAEAYRRHAGDRSGMIFCPSVASAHTVAAAVRQVGITAEPLSGKTPRAERKQILDRFRRGEIQVVTNAMLLGEGVDAPITSCVVVARPTMSKILFRQMVGRALRLHPGKEDALILDVVGATGRNDLKTLNDVTDVPLHVEEDEGLDQAARRVLTEPQEREGLIGDAMVSGSLAAIDIDPWAIEQARGRKRKASGEPMTDEELEAERLAREEEARQRAEEAERRERRRYKHVPMRSGWFFRTARDRWFIPLDTAVGQKGFVAVVHHGDDWSQHTVGLNLDDVDRAVLRSFDNEADAAQFALNFVLGVVEEAMERYKVDPDARWRRKPASQGQIEYAEQLVQGFDFDEYHYAGQVSDFITWGKWQRHVDSFCDRIAREASAVLV